MELESARNSLVNLVKFNVNQIISDSFLKQLRILVDRLAEAIRTKAAITGQIWCNETKLLDFPDLFIKIVHAEEFVKDRETIVEGVADHSQEILRQSITVLAHAANFVEFSKVFYTKSIAVYLLNILSRKIREPYQDQSLQKPLDFLDAKTCMNAIGNALSNEPRIGEQLRLHQCSDVLQRFFTCAWDEVALRAVLICVEINPDPTSEELKVPDKILKYLMKTLLLLLYGQGQKVNNIHTPATTYLALLQQLIVGNDDFNRRIVKFKYESLGISLVELLAQVLEAPEPSDVDQEVDYFHENIVDKAGNIAKQMYSTYAEKYSAMTVCWALLLSEFRYRRNSRAMRKHKRIIAALKEASSKPVKNLIEAGDGVLWLLQRNQPDDGAQENAGAENENDKQKLLDKRATSTPNNLAKQTNQNAADKQGNENGAPIVQSAPNQNDKQQRSNAAVPAAPAVKRTVVISYCSLYKPQLVHRINKSLKQAKIEAWMYNEKLFGKLYEALAKAIEECTVMLVCYSNAYTKSDACHAMLLYARFFSKPIVYVRLENFTAFGWLNWTMTDASRHDLALSEFDESEEADIYNIRIKKLLTELKKYHP